MTLMGAGVSERKSLRPVLTSSSGCRYRWTRRRSTYGGLGRVLVLPTPKAKECEAVQWREVLPRPGSPMAAVSAQVGWRHVPWAAVTLQGKCAPLTPAANAKKAVTASKRLAVRVEPPRARPGVRA